MGNCSLPLCGRSLWHTGMHLLLCLHLESEGLGIENKVPLLLLKNWIWHRFALHWKQEVWMVKILTREICLGFRGFYLTLLQIGMKYAMVKNDLTLWVHSLSPSLCKFWYSKIWNWTLQILKQQSQKAFMRKITKGKDKHWNCGWYFCTKDQINLKSKHGTW
jgi:hypothetical protein